MKWTEANLRTQLDFVTRSGWLPMFEAAAKETGMPVDFLLAIGSRETNLRNIKGDCRNGSYHGFGILQVDVRTDQAFCEAWTEDKVAESILRGAKILAGKVAYLVSKNQAPSVRNVAAAYNTGEGNVYRSLTAGKDPDRTTTGGDYGSDVEARKKFFAKLRTPGPLVPGPILAPLAQPQNPA